MELFSSMVRFNCEILVYKLYSTIWTMSNKMMAPRIPLSYNHLQYDATGRGISMEYFKSMRLELTVKY